MKKSVIRILMLVILVACSLLQFKHLSTESLLLSIASLAMVGAYVWHQQDIRNRLDFAEIVSFISFIALISMVQTCAFMPGIFKVYTLLFSYALIGVFVCMLVSLRFKKEEIATTVFTWLLLFPLLGLVVYFDSPKMWLVLPFVLLPSAAAAFPFRDIRVKEKFFLPIGISYLVAYVLAIFIPVLSTIIRHWSLTLLLILLTVTIVGTIMIIWKFREKILVNRTKDEEEAKRKKLEEENETEKIKNAMGRILAARSTNGVYDWNDVYLAYKNDYKGIDTHLLEVPNAGMQRFFTRSEIKDQVIFNGAIFGWIMSQYRLLFERTIDDEKLTKMKIAILSLSAYVSQWKGVKGYDSIIRMMKDNLGADLIVTLKINF